MKRVPKSSRRLAEDFLFILCGAVLGIVLVQTGALDRILGLLGSGPLAAFVSGIFFTSAFTIAPASIALASLSSTVPVPVVALFGALGAVMGDLILFFFIRDRFAKDLKDSLKSPVLRSVLRSFHFGFLKWLAPLFGALIIASPLPDELGLALLGLSRTRVILLVPVSFVMNWIGIYGIAYLPRVF
jgi:hypothetical protein